MKIYVYTIFFSYLITTSAYIFAQNKMSKDAYPLTHSTSHMTDVRGDASMADQKPVKKDGTKTYSDAVITHQIKRQINADRALSRYKMDVSTNDSVVMLNGTVKSDTDASALVEIAQSTAGVKDVNTTALKIENSSQPFTDIMITAKIKGTYLREKLAGKDIPATNISVETNNGMVFLSGSVNSKEQAANALSLAKTVTGVKEVHSRIKVKGDKSPKH